MLRYNYLRLIYLLVTGLIICGTGPALGKDKKPKLPKLTYVTGANFRSVNSLQPIDTDNAISESFIRINLPVWKTNKAKIEFFVRGFYSQDSAQFTFNHKQNLSVGISYSRKLHRNFSVAVNLQYARDYRPLSKIKRSGWRGNVTYFYYKSKWRNRPAKKKGVFRQKVWVSAWGSLTFPESLVDGNRNLAFITGGEIAVGYTLGKSNLQYVPFVDLLLAKDSYKLTSNNKAIAGVGFKIRKPVKGGEYRFGVKYAADRRWIIGTTETGPIYFGGFYKSF